MSDNVFVLSTGRCGSMTFARACGHMTNYTAGHQTRANRIGEERLRYPPRHIESDKRLAWFLGRLDAAYGERAFYVHLVRDRRATAESLARNFGPGITGAYYRGIITRDRELEEWSGELRPEERLRVCLDLWDTVTANIEQFLAEKENSFRIELASARQSFPELWARLGAEGDLEAALAEWDVCYNASGPDTPHPRGTRPLTPARLGGKLRRLLARLPAFLREV